MEPVERYRREARDLGSHDFKALLPCPFFVAREIVGGRLGHKHRAPQRIRASTLLHLGAETISDPREDEVLITRRLPHELCTPVMKTARTPREAAIAIGRFDTSDVVIPDYTVSKNHAWFAIDPHTGAFRIGDAGSTNGTWIEDVRLEPGEMVPVRSRQYVTIGRLTLELFSSSDFHAWLVAPHAVAPGRVSIR